MLERIFQRSNTYDPLHPKDPGLVRLFGGGSSTNSGVYIDHNTAKSITAFSTGVRIISETLSMLPWEYFSRSGTSNTKEVNSPVWALVNTTPNRFQNTFEYRETMISSLEYRGRAVAEKIFNNSGVITDLIPLNMDELQPFKAPNGTIAFAHTPLNGGRRILLADEVVDLRGPSVDGVNCLDPIRMNEETLGLSKAAEVYASRFFGAGTVPSGVLESDKALSDKAYARLQEWTERHQGIGKSHNPAILEDGVTWKPVSVDASQAQLLETRGYQVEDVARILRIPAYKLQRMDGVKFNTVEQQAIDFVTDTMLPRVRRFELAHDRALIGENQRSTFFTKIQISGLLRGDSKARSEYYKTLHMLGALSPNDIRDTEDMNPIDGGDRYYVPVNMVPVDRIDDQVDNNGSAKTTGPGDDQRMIKPFVRSIFERIVNSENNAIDRGKDMVGFYSNHKAFIERNTDPLVESVGLHVKDYFERYYINTLQQFESRSGAKWDDSRVDIDVESFFKFLNESQDNG